MAARRGATAAGTTRVLVRDLSDPFTRDQRVVETQGEARFVAGELITRGFLDGAPVSPTQAMVFRSYIAVSGMSHFILSIDGEPAAGAALAIRGDLALLTGMSVLPRFRGRHLQGAMIDHRLSVARDRGCRMAVVTASNSSRSQRNCQRAGFEVLYERVSLRCPLR